MQSVSYFFWGAGQTLSAILQIFFCFLLLYYKVKNAVFFVFAIIGGLLSINFVISYMMQIYYRKMAQEKDKRISLTTDVFLFIFYFIIFLNLSIFFNKYIFKFAFLIKVIQGIKSIKFLTYEHTFLNKILHLRSREFYDLCVIKILDAVLGIFWQVFPYFVLYIVLTKFAPTTESLQSTNIFTVLNL